MDCSETNQNVIGLLAGWGEYPRVVARGLRSQGKRVICVGIHDHADPRLRTDCDAFHDVGLGQLGRAIRIFQRHGVTQATMAGKIHKVLLFQRFYWLKHFPDWECARTFFPHFVTKTVDRKDDTMITAAVSAFARHGITFAPATEFLPDLLIRQGTLSHRNPSAAEVKDIRFGWKLAKELGRLDVGQSVAVKGRAALALEAIEGTDQCIQRAGQLCPAGGFTVVKVAKPQQDMRFDVPTIGLGTLRSLAESGGRVLAVEADRTILIDEPSVLDFANLNGLSIVSIDPTEWTMDDAN